MTDTTTTAFQARKAIDLTEPGGIERLLEFHRGFFGDARMEAGEGEASGGQDEGRSDSDPAAREADGRGEDRQDDERLGEGGRKALTAEREANRALRNEKQDLEKRLRELEDRDKTEEQKRAERLTELEQTAATAQRHLEDKDALILRYQVAAEKGLDLVAAERLRGSTREEIAEDADTWISRWGAGATPPRGKVPDPGLGARTPAKEDDFAAGEARARKRFGLDTPNT